MDAPDIAMLDVEREHGRVARSESRIDSALYPTQTPRITKPVVTIQLNGERHELPEPLTVDALLSRLEIDGRRVAVELNEYVVRKAAYAETLVNEGDAVEVVNFVGGG